MDNVRLEIADAQYRILQALAHLQTAKELVEKLQYEDIGEGALCGGLYTEICRLNSVDTALIELKQLKHPY
jgi:hypothetical protein